MSAGSIEMEWSSVKNYDVSGLVRGKVLILQMCNFSTGLMTEFGVAARPEAEVDGRDLRFRLRHAGFHVQLVKDPDREEVLRLIGDYTTPGKLTAAPSFMLVIMTYTVQPKGASELALALYDSFVSREELIKPFVECAALNGKPKIFVFQACKSNGKGENLVGGTLTRSGSSMRRNGSTRSHPAPREDNPGYKINQPRNFGPDLLVVESSVPGYWSFKNARSGSWFVQLFATALDFNVVNPGVDFVKLLVRMNGQMATASVEHPNGAFDPQRPSPAWAARNHKRKPTILIMSTLTRLLYIY
jgi:caspase Dronc